MIHNRPPGLFFTGSDTEVGKTYAVSKAVAALRSLGGRPVPYKPVASGCRSDGGGRLVSQDAEILWESCQRQAPLEVICPQCFAAPLAPPEAARREGKSVDQHRLCSGYEACGAYGDLVLVEGAGGLMSPIGEDWTNADLASALGLRLVIVVPNRLGAINQALLCATAAKSRKLAVQGVVLSEQGNGDDGSQSTNADWLRRFEPDLPVAQLAHGASELTAPDCWSTLLLRLT
jgi:dethiobiotin synthetase